MERREFKGATYETVLSADCSLSATTLSVADGSTYPTGANNPFVIVVDKGNSDEEKMLISSRSTNTFTIISRGYDGTTAVGHLAGAVVDHVLDAVAISDMNKTIYDQELLNWMGI